MITAVIAAIPSLIKLFSSDSRDDGVKELTSAVVSEVGKKLGVNLKTKEEAISHLNSNPEDAIKLRDIETKHLQSISSLKLETLKEDNRHDEHFTNKQVEDSQNAREMFKHGSELQTEIAKDIMQQTKWRIPFFIFLNIALVWGAKEFSIDPAVLLTAGNLIGMALKSDYDERTGVRNFLFGAMIAKIKKDK